MLLLRSWQSEDYMNTYPDYLLIKTKLRTCNQFYDLAQRGTKKARGFAPRLMFVTVAQTVDPLPNLTIYL